MPPYDKPGQPTKYREEYCEELIDFFEREAFKERVLCQGTGKEKIQLVPETFPTLQRFATSIGVCRETLRNWADAKDAEGNPKHPEFFRAFTRAKELQEAILVEGAMAGAYNSQFSQFAAINLFGWRNKQQFTGADDEPLIPKQMDNLELARRAAFVIAKVLHAEGKNVAD